VSHPSFTRGGEYGRIERLVLKHARDAFADDQTIAREWQPLNFISPPDFSRATREYDAFSERLATSRADVTWLPPAVDAGMDSIYVRDASIVTPKGIVLCHMGKPLRRGEPPAQAAAFRALGIPIVGAIEPPGQIEGGDVVWLDARTIAVGRGYRTNDAGIAQLRTLLGDTIDDLIVVPLPHWRGTGDVFHLMSIISPVDRDLAVVYSPLMPVPFRELVIARGLTLVEVPDGEFESMGANVLAIAPRECLMLSGNPETRARLEAAGARVHVYDGVEISVKGGGGPTCLTRPIRRVAV